MTTEQALSKLTDRERRLIELREGQKLTWVRIGEDLGVGGQYAAQLFKAAKKRLADLEATDENMLYDPRKLAGRILIDGKPTEGELMMEKLKATGWPHQAPQEPDTTAAKPEPKTVIATGQPQPRVVVVKGVPVAQPAKPIVEKHWSSVTIRS